MNELVAWALRCEDLLNEDGWELPEKPKDIYSFGKYVAEILTDPYDEQHVSILIVGQSGSGKSTVAVSLACSIAKYLAEIRGDLPEDHFNVRTHISVLNDGTAEEIKQRGADMSEQVFIIDEAGDDTNARRSMSRKNVEEVVYMAIVRTARSCIIRCAQYDGMVDSGVTRQMTHYIKMEESHHKEGYNVVKIKKLELIGDAKEPYMIYLKPNGRDKLKRHIIPAPDPETYTLYKEMRKEGAKERIAARGKKLGKREDRSTEYAKIIDEKCAHAWADLMEHPEKKMYQCALDADVDPRTLRKWIGRNNHDLKERETPKKRREKTADSV